MRACSRPSALAMSHGMSLPDYSTVLDHPTQKGVTCVLRMSFPGGERIVTACGDGLVRIFAPGTRACLHVLEGHSGPVAALAELGGGVFVTGGANLDCYLCLWRVETGERLFRRRLESWPQSVVGEMWAIAAVDEESFVVAVEVGDWSLFLFVWGVGRDEARIDMKRELLTLMLFFFPFSRRGLGLAGGVLVAIRSICCSSSTKAASM